MKEIKYDSYHKFCTSLGLALIVTSVGLIGYCFMNYQIIIDALSSWFPSVDWANVGCFPNVVLIGTLLFLALLIAGTGMHLFRKGRKKWSELQDDLDDQQRTETRLSKVNLKMAEEQDYARSEIKALDIIESSSEDCLKMHSDEKSRPHRAKMLNAYGYCVKSQHYLEIENQALDHIEGKLGDNYALRRHVKVGKKIYDAVAISNSDIQPDIVYEIKQSTAAMAGDRISQVCDRLQSENLAAYKAETGRECKAQLLLIVDDEHFDDVSKRCVRIQLGLIGAIEIKVLKKEKTR